MKVYLVEALTPEQRSEVNSWDHYEHHFSHHAFESPLSQRTYIELEHPQDSVHKSHVEDHLAKHGYKVHDYHMGLALDKHNRVVKIGKALGKTGGEHLIEGFTGDPARQQSKAKNDHMVVISRHPHDVAGMTSDGHSWENSSCMNFDTGSNKDYLPEDVRHGTHVAYLIHKDDRDIKNPLARIALKPFHGTSIDNIDNEPATMLDPSHPDRVGNTILRPEPRTYGDAPDAFSYTVNRWANKHFPGKNEAYVKNSELYHDGGSTTILSDSGVGKAVESRNPGLRTLAAASPSLSDEHAMKLARTDHGIYHYPLSKNPNISKEVANHIWLANKQVQAQQNLLEHPKHGDYYINHVLESDSPAGLVTGALIHHAIQSPQFTHKHVDKLMARPDFSKFHDGLTLYGIHKASGAQVSKLLDSYKGADPQTQALYADRLLDNHKTNAVVKHVIDNYTKKDAHPAYRDNPRLVASALLHPKSTLADFNAAMSHSRDKNTDISESMLHGRALKSLPHKEDVLNEFLNPSYGRYVNIKAANHDSITTRHIDKILEHPDEAVRNIAFAQHNAVKTTEAHHLKLLGDEKALLSMDGDDLHNLVSKHMRGKALDEAVNHPNDNVVHAAASNPHLNIRHLDQLVNRVNPSETPWRVRSLVKHPGLTAYHFDSLFRKSDGDLQSDLLDHPHVTAQHVDLLAHNVIHNMNPLDYQTKEAGSKVFRHPLATDQHRFDLAKSGQINLGHPSFSRNSVEPYLKRHHYDVLSPSDKSRVSFGWRRENDR